MKDEKRKEKWREGQYQLLQQTVHVQLIPSIHSSVTTDLCLNSSLDFSLLFSNNYYSLLIDQNFLLTTQNSEYSILCPELPFYHSLWP